MPGADDSDGDGIADATDNCPTVFNPVRPMDNGMQADADGDGEGDACDPCPLDANTTTCTPVDPERPRPRRRRRTATDNCPDVANPGQTDGDSDGKGDACDACPSDANPGTRRLPGDDLRDQAGHGADRHAPCASTNALVTGKGTNGFFVQTKTGDAGYMGADYSGLFVYTGTMAADARERGRRHARHDRRRGRRRSRARSSSTRSRRGHGDDDDGRGAPTPVAATYAEVKTGGTRAAQLESVLVALGAAQTVSASTRCSASSR